MNKKVVIITGASRGLGKAIAEAYHQNKFIVIAADITPENNSSYSDIESFTNIKLDVTSENDIKQCAVFVKEKYGRLDVLISSAGIFDFYPVSEAGIKKLKEVFDVNLFGLANLTKYFLPLLSTSAGRLIVISSESYKVPAPFQPYTVSKQALESLYQAIKNELSIKGIKSILIRPGAIQTNILDQTLQYENKLKETQYKKEFDKFIRTVPSYVNRISSPQKVADMVLKAGTKRNPKQVYSINHNPLVTLLSLLPARFKNYILRKSLS